MASIETVVQNADVEMGDDSKPDSTAEVKEEPGEFLQNPYYCEVRSRESDFA